MRIKLQNIGIIEEADINVDGITLIAGQNDSGKSTVGKVLYALIRSFNIDEKSFNSSKNEFIRTRIRDIRNLILRAKITNIEDKKIQEKFVSAFLDNEHSLFDRYGYRMSADNNTENNEKLLSELKSIKELYSNFSNESIKIQIETFVNDIINRASITIDSNEVLHYELESFFENEFGKQVKNKFKKGTSFVKIDGVKEKKISFDEHTVFEGFDTTTNIYYNDVFFIESPIKLHDRNFLSFDNILRDKNRYLNNKIFQPKKEQDIFSDTKDDIEKLNSIISEVINGEFGFNSKNELVFKKNKVEFDLNNVATGIKSFGVLQLLLQKGILNLNSLLIIDEPEVHLHPTWQVKYAEILVRLSKEFAIPMLLTSHSPYFIEALEAYSKKYNFETLTNFYLAEKNKNGLTSKIFDVTKDITPVLSSISDAFYKIQDIND